VRIRKAVFPVAGLGTRFLPATKASPKEMLPIVDKPLIQYAVMEAISAGAEELIFITGRTKNAIMDHFDKAYELETELEQRHKTALLQIVREILPPGVTSIYIRQAEALGLGHAVSCASHAIGDQDFYVLLADDLIEAKHRPCLNQMLRVYQQYGTSVIAVQRVPKEDVSSYGIVDVEPIGPGIGEIRRIIEKPKPEDAPSNLAVVGRYILTPRVFKLLETVPRGAGGEIQLTDAIERLVQEQTVIAYEFEGTL
jgi:UTP--glucose-1-phosphate uridylyltransferase